MASLADVSALAKTSIATASRVLNGSTHPVSPATRARVLAAAEELGYTPSALARALVTRSSRIIGLIVNDIVDPYFAEIARGVDDVAARAGYLTITCNADRRMTSELAHLCLLRDYHAEGIIFAGSGRTDDPQANDLDKAVAGLATTNTRVVALAKRDFESRSVVVDNRAAAYDVTDYLVSLGHRRIAFVEGPRDLYTSIARREGFVAAMTDASLDPTRLHEGGFDFESGLAAGARIAHDRSLPDAVVAANDEAAIGVLSGLRQAGIRVPRDVSVAGIDDTRPARFVELTTVNLPLQELGAAAAKSIITKGETPPAAQHLQLPHRLIPRATTARRR